MLDQSAPPDRVTEAVDTLRAAHGLDFARTRLVLCALTDEGDGHSVTELVARTGATRRRVEEIIAALGPTVRERDGRWRVGSAAVGALRSTVDCATVRPLGFDRPDLSPRPWGEVLERMRETAAGLPPSLTALDHVPATSETAVRRAYALTANYDLAGRHVLCLGDHDLTSIALTLVEPRIQVSVADIDERILGYIEQLSRRFALPVRTHFADLRVELPPGLRDAVDLVFTDPPYTPAGIGLFLARAVTALRRGPGSRVLFCYSHNERQLARGLEVQNEVSGLQLTVEAMLPEFNEFVGAESIGSRSALWVCQPTGKAWAAAGRRTGGVAIYTQGGQAEETPDHVVAAGSATALDELRDLAGDPSAQVVGVTPDAALSLEALLRTEPPAGQGGMIRPEATVLADLTGVHPSYAYRLLLRTLPARRVLVAVDGSAGRSGMTNLDGPVWRLLGARYRIRSHRGRGRCHLLEAVRRPVDEVPDGLGVARYIVDHPKAKLLGAWREGLIAQARRRGGTLSKNDARTLIAASVPSATIEGRWLAELPHAVIEQVAGAVLSDFGGPPSHHVRRGA